MRHAIIAVLAIGASGCTPGSILAGVSDTARQNKAAVTEICERETGTKRCRAAVELYDSLLSGYERANECMEVIADVKKASADFSNLVAGDEGD